MYVGVDVGDRSGQDLLFLFLVIVARESLKLLLLFVIVGLFLATTSAARRHVSKELN